MNIELKDATPYHHGQFPPKGLNHNVLLQSLLEATDALARYDQVLQSLHNSEIFLAPLRGQESLASSRMEGTFSTLEEIFQLQGETDDDDPLKVAQEFRSETVETYLYSRALRLAQHDLADGQPLSSALIKRMHQLLLSYSSGTKKSPGSFKEEQNYIGARGTSRVSFVPIAPEHLDQGIETLLAFAHDDSCPALLRVALCHIEFEALHPFKDGNGRVGRMLITLMLWHLKVISAPHCYISRYLEEHKADYIDRMREVSANGAWENWCIFFFTAVKEQAFQNLQVAEDTRKLYADLKPRFTKLLASRWSTQALDYLFTNPVFRNSRFTKQSGIPSQTAARFSRKLLEEGILSVRLEASGRQSAVYSFEPLLELVKQ